MASISRHVTTVSAERERLFCSNALGAVTLLDLQPAVATPHCLWSAGLSFPRQAARAPNAKQRISRLSVGVQFCGRAGAELQGN